MDQVKLDKIIDKLHEMDKKIDVSAVILDDLKEDLASHIVKSEKHNADDIAHFKSVQDQLDKLKRHTDIVKYTAGLVVIILPLLSKLGYL